MKVLLDHIDGMHFQMKAGSHLLSMDARSPIGRDHGPTPKELLLGAIAGCAGIDIAAFLKKHRIADLKWNIAADATARLEDPKIFPHIDLVFQASCPQNHSDLQGLKNIFDEAIRLSLTKYCGVSAMVNQTSPIKWTAFLNDELISSGQANFSL